MYVSISIRIRKIKLLLPVTHVLLAKIARLVKDHEDNYSKEEVKPLLHFKFPKPRRFTLLDDTNNILLH